MSGTVGETTLTVEQLASHTHEIRLASNSNSGDGLDAGKGSATVMASNRVATTGDSQPHTHTLDGASGEMSSLPPYYTLAYIMRCA